MHGLNGDRWEDLLNTDRTVCDLLGTDSASFDLALAGSAGDGQLQSHLAVCGVCAAKVREMRMFTEALRLLRVPDSIEPDPGFYARVIGRIEEENRQSVWGLFLSSSLSKRLVYASLTLAAVFGSYVVAHEGGSAHLNRNESMVAQISYSDSLVFGSSAEKRDAVLTNFVSQ